jgi:ribosome-associated translation inhibitor RaiA
MELDIQARDFPLTAGLHAAIVAASQPYATAFEGAVRKLAVRVYDLNGPRGGPDKGCLVVADLNDGRVVVSSDVDADLYRAIPRAFGKLRRATQSHRRRAQQRRRSSGAAAGIAVLAPAAASGTPAA